MESGLRYSCIFHGEKRAQPLGQRNQAWRLEDAMNAGFAVARFRFGVPMIPLPQSEAWWLAYCQKGLDNQSGYNKAKRFEDIPANDHSPKLDKKLLQTAVGTESESDTYFVVMDEIGGMDGRQVDMPSFNHSRCRFGIVLDAYQCAMDSETPS